MHSLPEIEAFCLQTISQGQQENGEFKTFLFFPEKAENGWIYAGPSVFLTSSIAITLLKNENPLAQDICSKAAQYVKSQMEPGGLWRFYPHHGLFKFNTPMDSDDTSLASYLLQQKGFSFPDNRANLYKQVTRKGDFYIWFLPRIRFLSNPILLLRLVLDLRHSFPVFFPLKGRTTAALINYNDTEHAVNANAILYLGERPETQKSINHLVEDLLFGNTHNQYFYPGILYTYYHTSRLYSELGIKQFENLRNKVTNYFLNGFNMAEANVQDKAIAALTLVNFNIKLQLIDDLFSEIRNCSFNDIASPYDYFCTKDRKMAGGCAEFTCAIVAEAIRKYSSGKL